MGNFYSNAQFCPVLFVHIRELPIQPLNAIFPPESGATLCGSGNLATEKAKVPWEWRVILNVRVPVELETETPTDWKAAWWLGGFLCVRIWCVYRKGNASWVRRRHNGGAGLSGKHCSTRRSFARMAIRWLSSAALEYTVPTNAPAGGSTHTSWSARLAHWILRILSFNRSNSPRTDKKASPAWITNRINISFLGKGYQRFSWCFFQIREKFCPEINPRSTPLLRRWLM